MKILVVLSRFPWPLDKGDKLRAYHQLRLLSRSHEVHLVALSDKAVDQKSVEELNKFCTSIKVIRLSKTGIVLRLIRNIFSALPFQVAYFRSHEAQKYIDRKRSELNPDITLYQLIRTAAFASGIPGKQLLDYMDALSYGMAKRAKYDSGILRPLWKIEYQRLSKYELEVYQKFRSHFIISVRDRDQLKLAGKPVTVLPNGIDHSIMAGCTGYDTGGHILFHGNMSYPPNEKAAILLAESIMPQVRAGLPGKKLIISGASPSSAVRRLAGKYNVVTGWIDNLCEVFNGAAVFAAPLQLGTGMQNKLFEAMAAGIPCITTPEVAEAIGASHMEHLIVADSTRAFADGILLLGRDIELADRLIMNARKLLDRYTWENHLELLESSLEKAQVT